MRGESSIFTYENFVSHSSTLLYSLFVILMAILSASNNLKYYAKNPPPSFKSSIYETKYNAKLMLIDINRLTGNYEPRYPNFCLFPDNKEEMLVILILYS